MMKIYCLEDFKFAFEKLKSKNSYKSIEQDTINYFFNKSSSDLSPGTRLNNSDLTPYIKKRLGGRGGFRFYYLLLIKDDRIYLMYVHPKTGVYGAENITDESKAMLYKKLLTSIENKNLYQLFLNSTEKNIIFQKMNFKH